MPDTKSELLIDASLLKKIEGDAKSREEDPDPLGHILMKIRMWHRNADADVARISHPPELEGCKK